MSHSHKQYGLLSAKDAVANMWLKQKVVWPIWGILGVGTALAFSYSTSLLFTHGDVSVSKGDYDNQPKHETHKFIVPDRTNYTKPFAKAEL